MGRIEMYIFLSSGLTITDEYGYGLGGNFVFLISILASQE